MLQVFIKTEIKQYIWSRDKKGVIDLELIRKRYNDLILEVIRYLIVGGIAFVIDFTVLYVSKEFILKDSYYSLYVSTAMGFISGLIVNYCLSIFFVFNSAKGTQKGRSAKDMFVFTVVGILGLIVSEFGMFIGAEELAFNYLLVKIVVTAVVLLWNYIARKILIFK